MTMIISAHLGDCILIAADKRAMIYDLNSRLLRISHDDEAKIKLWCRGAITGTGDSLLISRIMNYFENLTEQEQKIEQINAIQMEIERRLSEGVPKEFIFNNTLIFSIFNGYGTSLYTIPIQPFFETFKLGGREHLRAQVNEIKEWTIEVCCLNIPSDLALLQDFQRNLRSLNSFESEGHFISYYIENLKTIFAKQASIDTSVTPSFDLYLQSCETGCSFAIHIENNFLTTSNV
ncbi:hypothetical protein [Acinetobacter sp. yr461]|uniref:hypothetical protein n=1 Tax=Acinetobacter sp. yr461 TaxID=1761742 RepID=UPI000B874CCB|nr:hypothetical protein [Acinetobacter sp. yr461]